MEPRIYYPADREACLAVFDSNRLSDRDQFEQFLDRESCVILEHEGSVVGCGGYEIHAARAEARLVWGMIRRDVQGNGLGRFLLLYRLRKISKCGVDVQVARISAPSQHAGFFEKQGFKRAGEAINGTVELAMKLTVCP